MKCCPFADSILSSSFIFLSLDCFFNPCSFVEMLLQQEASGTDLESTESILWARLQSVMKDGSKLLDRIQQLESEKASLEAFFIEDGDTSGTVR